MEHYPITYRTFLRDTLLEKKKLNPQFSLRSFARVLGVQPTFLSFVINGKRDLSDDMIEQFTERLKLVGRKAKIFELLVRIEKTKNASLKNKLLTALKQIDPTRTEQRDLTVEHFTLISEWYHYAIFMLIDIEDFAWSPQNVATSIGVNVFEVKAALERLRSLNLIEFAAEERHRKLETRILAKSETSSAAIAKYHSQLLHKTLNSLEQCPRHECFNGSEVITLSQEQLQDASEIIEECYQKIFSLSQRKTKQKRVYQLGIHLIPLSRNKPNQRKIK